MTAGRTYLSIGDVLSLLRQEFPDVTISKIRFLESQGLVNPERTPSGYRKFYEHDVDRLRWVLRQQREHFLPLKVIKGRLEDENGAAEESPNDAESLDAESLDAELAGAELADSGAIGPAAVATGAAAMAAEAEHDHSPRSAGAYHSAGGAKTQAGSRAQAGSSGQAGSSAAASSGRGTPTRGANGRGSSDAVTHARGPARPAGTGVGALRTPALPGFDSGPSDAADSQSDFESARPGSERHRAPVAASATAAPAPTGGQRRSPGLSAAGVARPQVAGRPQGAAVGRHAAQAEPDGEGALRGRGASGSGSGVSGSGAAGTGSDSSSGSGSGSASGSRSGAGAGAASGDRMPSGRRTSVVKDLIAGAPVTGPPDEGGGRSASRGDPDHGTDRSEMSDIQDPFGPHGYKTGSTRLTTSELAAASGLPEATIDDLESYGIIQGKLVGGVMHYDELELVVARLAASFAQFGIEPRHLRLYKHASERESGFVEQLVLPLLKQRNPEARRRAADMVSELTELGQGLRAALVQRSLQDLLGG